MRLIDRHPGFGRVAAAVADWHWLQGIALLLADDQLLSAGTYEVMAEAVYWLSFRLVGPGTIEGMRGIGVLVLVLGIALRWALWRSRSARMLPFRWLWVVATIHMFTWVLACIAAIVLGLSTAVTGVMTYLALFRIMLAGTEEPLDNPVRRVAVSGEDD